jgi:hypothetical protein
MKAGQLVWTRRGRSLVSATAPLDGAALEHRGLAEPGARGETGVRGLAALGHGTQPDNARKVRG